jgi:hypothetical protein
MNINWRDILGEISGYKELYEATLNELNTAKTTIDILTDQVTEAQETIRRLETTAPTPTAPTPAPPVLDNTTEKDTPEKDTASVQPQEGTVLRRIRSQQVIDCPRENRVVPLHALEAGANHDQFTCGHCPHFKSATCNYVSCRYGA